MPAPTDAQFHSQTGAPAPHPPLAAYAIKMVFNWALFGELDRPDMVLRLPSGVELTLEFCKRGTATEHRNGWQVTVPSFKDLRRELQLTEEVWLEFRPADPDRTPAGLLSASVRVMGPGEVPQTPPTPPEQQPLRRRFIRAIPRARMDGGVAPAIRDSGGSPDRRRGRAQAGLDTPEAVRAAPAVRSGGDQQQRHKQEEQQQQQQQRRHCPKQRQQQRPKEEQQEPPRQEQRPKQEQQEPQNGQQRSKQQQQEQLPPPQQQAAALAGAAAAAAATQGAAGESPAPEELRSLPPADLSGGCGCDRHGLLWAALRRGGAHGGVGGAVEELGGVRRLGAQAACGTYASLPPAYPYLCVAEQPNLPCFPVCRLSSNSAAVSLPPATPAETTPGASGRPPRPRSARGPSRAWWPWLRRRCGCGWSRGP